MSNEGRVYSNSMSCTRHSVGSVQKKRDENHFCNGDYVVPVVVSGVQSKFL